MADKGAKGKAAREAMAKLSGTDLAGFDAQLDTTRMFYAPKQAVSFTTGGSFRYDPMPKALVSRRRRLRFVYFDGRAPRPLSFAAVRTDLAPG